MPSIRLNQCNSELGAKTLGSHRTARCYTSLPNDGRRSWCNGGWPAAEFSSKWCADMQTECKSQSALVGGYHRCVSGVVLDITVHIQHHAVQSAPFATFLQLHQEVVVDQHPNRDGAELSGHKTGQNMPLVSGCDTLLLWDTPFVNRQDTPIGPGSVGQPCQTSTRPQGCH